MYSKIQWFIPHILCLLTFSFLSGPVVGIDWGTNKSCVAQIAAQSIDAVDLARVRLLDITSVDRYVLLSFPKSLGLNFTDLIEG